MFYYYQDKLGSTSQVANASGALLESYRYDLYGTPSYYRDNMKYDSSMYGISDLYAGERWASELSLYDLRNRFMSPELGRFLQPDPIGFKGDSANIYRFCNNNAVNQTDPTGLEAATGSTIAERMRFFYGDGAQGSSLYELDHPNQANVIMAGQYTSEGTAVAPIPNPRSKASAEAVWAGETPVDNSMSRDQIIDKYAHGNRNAAGAATTANYPEPTVTMPNGRPKITQPITATRHMPNNVSQSEYNRLYAIETKSVRCIQNSVGGASIRLSNLVRNMSDANSAKSAVMQSINRYMRDASLECRWRADGMGDNASP